MIVLGIDPGVSGGIAVLHDLDFVEGLNIPSGDGTISVPDLIDWLVDIPAPDAVVIERVASMPKQGVSTTFTFGRAYGTLEGVVQALGWPLAHIPPSTWKKHLGFAGLDKDAPRLWCRQRWPQAQEFALKGKGQAIADATCLAVAWQQRGQR
jgi:crossover junction endodeoxyribonuclease RuvC